MKEYKDTKIVVIGFGFLMGYLEPCYTQFFDEKTVKTHVIAVTADETTLEAKREQYPFPVLLNNNQGALEQMDPDIIFFAPPPSVAPSLAREVLKPYYDVRRLKNEPLPDLYAFPPSPQGQFYLELLGKDIHVCNILPNMMSEINGVSLNGAEGNSHITIPEDGPWPEENLRRLEKIFSPYGGVVYVPTDNVLDMLASLCIVEVIPLLLYNMADAAGYQANALASAMRGWHQKRYQYYPEGSTACDTEAVGEEASLLLKRINEVWMDSMVQFLTDAGMTKETADKILVANMDLKLHCCQLQDREKTEDDLRNHATKGGVAEKARMCYELLLEPEFKKRMGNPGELLQDELFFRLNETVTYEIMKIVAAHSRKLDGNDGMVKLKPDHSAMLFALFVRNANRFAQEAGGRAAHEGLLLYADQRGRRMAKRAFAHGDTNSMINYMAYGEWTPLPGTMEQENVQLRPAVITHVCRCPWYTAWERFGFMEEGKEYCNYVDYNLVKGFNRELELKVNQVRPNGAPYCEFVWTSVDMDEKQKNYLAEKQKELGESCKKDWLFHTRHTYSAMKEKLIALEQGSQIVEQTMKDFETLYGAAVRKAVEDCQDTDFYEI